MRERSLRAADRWPCRYRITVVGELSQWFVGPLENVAVESAGRESVLICDVIDEAKLQSVLGWLYGRGIELVSVVPVDDGDQPIEGSQR